MRDFGAIPNDAADDTRAIQNAIDAALATGEPEVRFDAGEYRVAGAIGRSPYNHRRVCLLIDGAQSGLALRGATHADGTPATALVYDQPGPHFPLDYWMWVSRSKDITIENLLIDFPGAVASGQITKVAEGKTWVELWPEVVKPTAFIPGDEYAFLYDPKTGAILQPKITLGGGWDETLEESAPRVERDTPWTSPAEGRNIVIDAEIGAVGQGLAIPVQWHHAPEKTFVANRVDGLTLRNITVVTALGHCFLPVACRNVTVQGLRFDASARGTHRGWTARRDGLTLRACRGQLLVEDSVFQNASDDLLAFWAFQFHIERVLSPTTIVVASHQASGDYFLDFPLMIEPGDWIEYRQPQPNGRLPLSGIRSTIRSAIYWVDHDRHMPWTRQFREEIEKHAYVVEYTLELNEPIPDFIATGSPRVVLLGSTLLDSAVLRRVTTRNVTNHPGVLIAGARDYLIEDCTFGTQVEIRADNGTRTWHGGTGAWNATIRGNTFTFSPVVPWRKGFRIDSIDTLEPRGELVIEDNTFLADAPLVLGGAQPVVVRDNTFASSRAEPPIILSERHPPRARMFDNKVVPYSRPETPPGVRSEPQLARIGRPTPRPPETQPTPRRTLRLLTVGNSFANNALQFLPELAESVGFEFVLFRANFGSASLEGHAGHLEAANADPADPEGRPYVAGFDPATDEKHMVSLVDALRSDRWDFVTIQQVSFKSFDPATYEPFAGKLIAAIRENAPRAKILVHETWAYREDHDWFTSGTRTQKEMYDGLHAAYADLAARYGLGMLPVGDAFQFARAKPEWHFAFPDPNFDYEHPAPECLPAQPGSLNNGWIWKDDPKTGKPKLTLDANHANTAGCYLASCVWLEVLTGVPAIETTWHPESLSEAQAASLRSAAHEAAVAMRARSTAFARAD